MLQAGMEKKEEGIDVVVGLLETHKRKETEDQLKFLEVIPRKKIEYRGHTFEELDLDAVLQRNPQLVLVDECAHTNVPGSRHPKRFKDIEELLQNGIDVYTTLNVQHLESLKDIVAEITHITVQETVPDSFLKLAHEVQLIDLPPDDLLRRLAEGKVYIGDQAKEAVDHFFTTSNLLSLRELALKHAVTVVDDAMAYYVQEHGIKGPWHASERVMVCVTSSANGPNLVRAGRRTAEGLQAKFIVVTVETPEDEERTITERQQLTQTLQLAESLGGEVVSLDGSDVAETLVDYANGRNITQLVLGREIKPTLFGKIKRRWRSSIIEKVLNHAPHMTISVITEAQTVPEKFTFAKFLKWPESFRPYFFSLVIPIAALITAQNLHAHLSIGDVSMIFFISILLIAIQFGLWPSLLATIICVFFYDYYFIDPSHNLGIDNPQGWLNLILFSVAAILVSNLATRARDVSLATHRRLRQARVLSSFVQHLFTVTDDAQVLHLLCHRLSSFFHINTISLKEQDGILQVLATYSPPTSKSSVSSFDQESVDLEAARWTYLHGERSGASTDTFSEAHYLFLPLKIDKIIHGVIGIRAWKNSLSVEQLRMIQLLVDQATLAIDRLHLLER